MKKTYLCGSCHQYHPLNDTLTKKQKQLMSTPYLRFSDLFGHQPKANPKLLTISRDIDEQTNHSQINTAKKNKIKTSNIMPPFHQMQRRREELEYLKSVKLMGEKKIQKRQRQSYSRDASRSRSSITSKISRLSKASNANKSRLSFLQTPLTHHDKKNTKPGHTMITRETNKKQVTPINISQYISDNDQQKEGVMLKPYLVSNREEKFQKNDLDYSRKISQLKELLTTQKKEKHSRKIIPLGCKKQYCTIKDNRCCGIQVFDEGEVNLQLSPIQ